VSGDTTDRFSRRAPRRNAAELREAFGPVRGTFRAVPDRFDGFQRRLNQARFGTTYDRYLARTVWLAALAAVVGLVLGAGVAGWLLTTGTVVLDGVAWALFALPLLGAGLAGGVVAGGRYLHPTLVVRHRRNSIDAMLPHAIVFTYALTHGGETLYEVLSSLAGAEETYGPVADEFGQIVADVDRFDVDLFTAIEHARELTPSDDLATFLDELVSVLETGGDLGAFLEGEADAALDRAEADQSELLEDLSLLAHVHVAAAFAGPSFLLVVLFVVTFLGGSTLRELTLLVYVGLPLVVAAFVYAVGRLDRPFREYAGRVGRATPDPDGIDGADGRLEAYRQVRRRQSVRERLRRPFALVAGTPAYSLLVTVPLALLAIGWLLGSGRVTATLAAFDVAPVATTSGLVVLPGLVVGTPYAVLHERRTRVEAATRNRFPDALEVLADATRNGVPLTEAFGLVARRLTGPMAVELERTHNDAGWSDDLEGSLRGLADRVGVPTVTRVVRLLVEVVHVTDDLGPVLRVVADDVSRRNELRRERQRVLGQYVVIVTVGVLVYLGIVALFESFLLPQLAGATVGVEGVRAESLPSTDIARGTYRRLFYHSALVQGVGNGLLLGRLTGDSVADGVKYAVAFAAIVAGTFHALAIL
jgi:flagellar protein FlaJ